MLTAPLSCAMVSCCVVLYCVVWCRLSAGWPVCSCSAGWYGEDCSLGYCATDCNYPLGSCNRSSAQCSCAHTPVGTYSGSQCLQFTPSHATERHTRAAWAALSSLLVALALAVSAAPV